MDKASFLAQVREAARAGQAYRVHTQPIPAGTGYVGVSGDLCERLAAEINAVGGEALVVSDRATAQRALSDLLAKYQVRSAFCWKHEVLDRLGVAEMLRERQIAQHDPASLAPQTREAQRATVLAADIGITSCSLAIAETGTLMMCSQPDQPRMGSLVPPVHVALVEAGQIVPDLFDAFEHMKLAGPQNLPSNLVFITGPSKTGDIELQLTTGVHGPKHWHVIVIRS